MEFPGNLFVVAAPSGAGKSSLVKALLEIDAKLAVSISHTSRAPRGQEQHGREYWFISPDEFRAMGRMLNWWGDTVVIGGMFPMIVKDIHDHLRPVDCLPMRTSPCNDVRPLPPWAA